MKLYYSPVSTASRPLLMFIADNNILRCNFSAYPNVQRWLNTRKARPNWAKVNKPFYDMAGRFKDCPFVAV